MKCWPKDRRYYLDDDNKIIGPSGNMLLGSIQKSGYNRVKMSGKSCFYHRAVIECHMGRMLKDGECVDHINGNILDNRPENLRITTRVMNSFNRKSRIKGWCLRKGRKKAYQAQIRKDGVLIHLGSYLTKEEARSAYLEARRKLFPGADKMDPGVK